VNPGKLFEQDFQNSVPPYVYSYRLKDCPAWVSQCECPGGGTRFTPKNDYDYAVFWDGNLWALELKSTKAKSIRFDALRENQLAGLMAAAGKRVFAGVLVNFRTVEETWFIPILNWTARQRTSSKKSIGIAEARELGVQLHGEKKISRWRYDVASFLRERWR
jgi:penicillin-binding protein-related factor A (putative recombinase)